MALADQLGDQRTADCAGRPSDEDFHGCPPHCPSSFPGLLLHDIKEAVVGVRVSTPTTACRLFFRQSAHPITAQGLCLREYTQAWPPAGACPFPLGMNPGTPVSTT